MAPIAAALRLETAAARSDIAASDELPRDSER
jgi:hypothetical protein